MNEKTLKEAVSILYDMELNNYLMTISIQELNYRISQLGHRNNFYIPEKEEARFNGEWVGGLGSLGLILGAIFGGVSGCNSTTSLLGSAEAGIGGLIGGGVLGFIIGAVIGLICGGISMSNRDSKYEEKYEKEMQKYHECVNNDKRRVEKELKLQKILIAERDSLIERREKAERILSEFYIRVGIDRRFRKLIPIGKMNELISLNITTRLEGDNGLYDRVRKELREDVFYAKLEEISSKLDTIISQQDRIYNELLDIGSQCGQLIDATMKSAQIAVENNRLLNEAVENTRISAYNSERIAVEERYQSMLMIFDRV